MRIFADHTNYENILNESDDAFLDEMELIKITTLQEALGHLKHMDYEEDTVVFFKEQGYKGSVSSVAIKIAQDEGII